MQAEHCLELVSVSHSAHKEQISLARLYTAQPQPRAAKSGTMPPGAPQCCTASERRHRGAPATHKSCRLGMLRTVAGKVVVRRAVLIWKCRRDFMLAQLAGMVPLMFIF